MRHPLRMSDCNSRGGLCLAVAPPYWQGASVVSCCSSSISIKKQLFCQEEQEIVGHTSVLSTPPLIHSSRILIHLVCLHTLFPLLRQSSFRTPPTIVWMQLTKGFRLRLTITPFLSLLRLTPYASLISYLHNHWFSIPPPQVVIVGERPISSHTFPAKPVPLLGS